MQNLKKTALNAFHKNYLNASVMAEFAGYEMPIQYKNWGIIKEAQACRQNAAFFDVSHMGQARFV